VFEGEMRNGLKQGKGTYAWKHGQRYSGDWVDDKAVGVGKITFASGDIYEGEVNLGEAQGEGSYTFADGDRYIGVWVGGKKNGKGRYLWKDGSYWEGEFSDDKQTANGTMVFPSEATATARATTAESSPPKGQRSGE
jgi:hypothetical protein